MDSTILAENEWYNDRGAVSILVLTLLAFMLPMIYVYPPFPPRESDALLETHYKLGLEHPSESNLMGTQFKPEHGPKPATNGSSRSTSSAGGAGAASAYAPARVQSIWIYPVKSCRGIELARSRVVPAGFEFDRLFTFAQLKSPFPVAVDASADEQGEHTWQFITQRQFPLLATVELELWRPDLAKCKRRDIKASESFVLLRFPWREDGFKGTLAWLAAKALRGVNAQPEKEVMLPIEFPSAAEIEKRGYTHEKVKIWNEVVSALNMSPELPEELQLYLGVSNKLALFRIDPDKLREVYRCAPTEESAGYQPVTGFQDAYPLHLLNLSSVQDLDSKLRKDEDLTQLDARRFRANIIISGASAYEEEKWKSVRLLPQPESPLDAADFHVSCRTVRCKMPNVNPDSGFRHPVEPDKSLRAYRNVDEGFPLGGCLGMQLTPLFSKKTGGGVTDKESTVEVGMSIKVLETGAHRYIKQ